MAEGLNPIETGKKLHEHGGTLAREAKEQTVMAVTVAVIPALCRSARRCCSPWSR
jgi:hypothetical protein